MSEKLEKTRSVLRPILGVCSLLLAVCLTRFLATYIYPTFVELSKAWGYASLYDKMMVVQVFFLGLIFSECLNWFGQDYWKEKHLLIVAALAGWYSVPEIVLGLVLSPVCVLGAFLGNRLYFLWEKNPVKKLRAILSLIVYLALALFIMKMTELNPYGSLMVTGGFATFLTVSMGIGLIRGSFVVQGNFFARAG